VLIGLIAIGLTGAGLFTADPLNGYPLETPALPDAAARTTHGVLHDAFSALVFLGLPAACCVVGYRFARSGHRSWAAYSVGTAVVFLTGFVLADMGFAQHPTFVPIAGLLQRLTLIAGLAWITALALYLIRRRPELHRPPPQLSQQTAGAVASTSVRAFGAHHAECLERRRASGARLVCLKGKAMMDNKDTGGRQTVPLRRPWDLILVSGFTILAGFAEIVTGFSHKFFGITTSDVALFTIAATGIGLSYLASGVLILTMKKWAATVAVVLLSIDVAGRILLAATGLYPTDTAKNTFSLIAGTLIVALVALYIGWKWKSFA